MTPRPTTFYIRPLLAAALVGVWVLALGASPLRAADESEKAAPPPSLVGLASQLRNVVVPGTELEARPQFDRREPISVRIVQSYPHGTDFRYDLEYFGLEAGTFDLTKYLQRKDGTPLGDVKPIEVKVVSSLPPGHVLPHELPAKRLPWLGGYAQAVGLGMILWLAVMALILFGWRPKEVAKSKVLRRPVTLADKLRPLIEQGARGTLSAEQCAALERTLLTYWTRKLQLQGTPPQELYPKLRSHAIVGPLLQQLEAWLHQRPGTSQPVDVEKLLQPYRTLSADALDEPATSRGAV